MLKIPKNLVEYSVPPIHGRSEWCYFVIDSELQFYIPHGSWDGKYTVKPAKLQNQLPFRTASIWTKTNLLCKTRICHRTECMGATDAERDKQWPEKQLGTGFRFLGLLHLGVVGCKPWLPYIIRTADNWEIWNRVPKSLSFTLLQVLSIRVFRLTLLYRPTFNW